ncbi:hypothetical protein SLEP1_g59289, partial [Rubroshorea leprosula]
MQVQNDEGQICDVQREIGRLGMGVK